MIKKTVMEKLFWVFEYVDEITESTKEKRNMNQRISLPSATKPFLFLQYMLSKFIHLRCLLLHHLNAQLPPFPPHELGYPCRAGRIVSLPAPQGIWFLAMHRSVSDQVLSSRILRRINNLIDRRIVVAMKFQPLINNAATICLRNSTPPPM